MATHEQLRRMIAASPALVLDRLREAEYDPSDDPVFALIASGTGSVIVDLSEEGIVTIIRRDRFSGEIWSAHIADLAPLSTLFAVLDTAERELADERGGPVTPVMSKPVDAQKIAREVQAEQGWTDVTLLNVVLDFVSEQGAAAFKDYLRERQFDENSYDIG